MKRIFIIGLILAGFFGCAYAQTGMPRELRKVSSAPEEIVSFLQTTSFDLAIESLNDLSKKYLGKIIVDPETRTQGIGIDINQMHWLT
ncbi:MAG: hypothetical protein KDE52_08265, partial [Calditrichaeota bacterium]|nr:hypothetical protein [Calditrichota bacterium]